MICLPRQRQYEKHLQWMSDKCTGGGIMWLRMVCSSLVMIYYAAVPINGSITNIKVILPLILCTIYIIYLWSCYSRERERLHATGVSICSSICLSVCRQIGKTRFSQKLSNLELWSLLTTYRVHGLFKEPIIGPTKSKMAEIRHLENRHDVIFSADGGPIWIKLRRLVQNDMSTAVIWSKS